MTPRWFAQAVATVPTVTPSSRDELSECLATAYARGDTVVPMGCGTHQSVGVAPEGCDRIVSTRGLQRIIAHEAADLTVTVEAGISIADLNAVLATAGQHLPIDPPLPQVTTIGAALAMDASGPLRLSQGKLRDLLIGITVVLADGRVIHGGGRVVKNVAGYDLMKLFTGSFGTLGIIAEASFKVRPVARNPLVLVAAAQDLSAALDTAQRLLATLTEPLYVSVVNAAAATALGLDGPAVVIGCGGAEAEVAVQQARFLEVAAVCAITASAAIPLYTDLRDLAATSLADHALGAKLSVLPVQLAGLLAEIEREGDASIVAHVGNGVAHVRFPAVGESTATAMARALVERAAALGGWVSFDHVPDELRGHISPWPMTPPGLELMQGIKQALDPDRRLNRGRFVGGI